MNHAYKSDAELCKWLRDNSSGDYRLAAFAADRIETLSQHLLNVQIAIEDQEEEIRKTWRAARDAEGQLQSFRILERMVYRLGYGRKENNPSLA